MKAKIFTMLGFFLLSSLAMAENKPSGVFANFETVMPGAYNVDWGMFTDPDCYAVVDNPLIDATDVSPKCLKIIQKNSFAPWGSTEWYCVNVDVLPGDSMIVNKTSSKHYLHVKYLSNVVSQRIGFTLVATSSQTFATQQIVSVIGKWVDVVLDLNVEGNQLTAFYELQINPNHDFQWFPGDLADQTTYIDDIEIDSIATPRIYALPEKTLADFETVTPVTNAAGANITDPAAVTVVDNPASDATNSTSKCLKVLQKASYKPWANGDLYYGGLIMSPTVAFDNTNASHFLHFKYLSNVSGATINVELVDTAANIFDYPLTVSTTGKWVEVAVDLSGTDYTLANIAEIDLSPDNTYQTNGHTADEITYFDEIKINDIATTGGTTAVSTVSSDNILLFPSIAREVLNISGITIPTTASIYNLNGKLVQTKILINGINQLNVTNLTKGIYIVKLQTENNTVAKKFVKQ